MRRRVRRTRLTHSRLLWRFERPCVWSAPRWTAGTRSAEGTRRCWGQATQTRCRCDLCAQTSPASSHRHWQQGRSSPFTWGTRRFHVHSFQTKNTGIVTCNEWTCSVCLTMCCHHPGRWSLPALWSQTSQRHWNTPWWSSQPHAHFWWTHRQMHTDVTKQFFCHLHPVFTTVQIRPKIVSQRFNRKSMKQLGVQRSMLRLTCLYQYIPSLFQRHQHPA